MRPGLFRIINKATSLLPYKLYRQALCQGVPAAIEHRAIIRTLEFSSCVDVGANIGQFSLLIRNEHPDSNIIAFEPLGGPAETYRNLFVGDPQVVLHQVALGLKAKTANMHVSQTIDSSSLLPISTLQEKQYPNTKETGREAVIVAPMTEYISPVQLQNPTLLKIDVQGFELEVLKSAQALLPYFKWIYVEASFLPFYEGQALAHEVITYLQARKFKLNGLYNPSFDEQGLALQGDFLFENIGF